MTPVLKTKERTDADRQDPVQRRAKPRSTAQNTPAPLGESVEVTKSRNSVTARFDALRHTCRSRVHAA